MLSITPKAVDEYSRTFAGKEDVRVRGGRRRARLVGSEVELHVWQGMVHVFPADLALLHTAREALDVAGATAQSRSMQRFTVSHWPIIPLE